MGHSTNAPEGHRLPHAATMPTLNPKTHKHFQSHSHAHVATPYPILEHSTSLSNIESDSSTGSTDYMQSHKHHHHHAPSISNPMHTIHDHISEFRFGHASRSAKREAQKSSSSHPWSMDVQLQRGHSIPEEQYEEVVEDWKERDQQAWAEELRKREAAKKSFGGCVTTTVTVKETVN